MADRSIPFALRVLRAYYGALGAVSPTLAEWRLVDRFFTPRRPNRRAGGAPAGEEKRIIHSTEGALAVYERGAGPAVLLVHGWEGTAADLAPIADAVVAAGFRAVSVDLPAHGASEGRRASLPVFVRALRAVADDVGPPAAVVAHSLGGAAATLALRDGLHADRAVLLAPPLEPLVYLRRLAEAMGLPHARFDGLVRRTEARAGVAMHTLNAAEAARALAIPALVFHGQDDREVPFEHGCRIARAWPGARLVPLRGLGHRRLLRAPRVIDAVAAFVSGADVIGASDVDGAASIEQECAR